MRGTVLVQAWFRDPSLSLPPCSTKVGILQRPIAQEKETTLFTAPFLASLLSPLLTSLGHHRVPVELCVLYSNFPQLSILHMVVNIRQC